MFKLDFSVPVARTHPLSVAILLTVVAFIGILTLPATLYGGDPVAWQAEARSILVRGELNVPSSLATTYGEPGQFFVLNHNNGNYYSKYGTLNGILNVVPLLVGQLINNPVLAVGIFAVVLSGIIAYVLYDLTGYYVTVEWVRVAFVLLCFYTTYAWNYLRCTASEATQWLFFLLVVRTLLRLSRSRKEDGGYRLPTVLALWLWTGCLCLTKVSWLLLIPLLAGALIYLARRQGFSLLPWRTIILPVALICVIIAMNNWVKFGAPWLSGYHQWHDPNPRIDFLAAFYDFTVNPQWSFFVCFPPLLLAIPGWKRFWREHEQEAIFILAVFAVYLLVNILRGNWRGEWCYGPRYFLFILPLLALPAVYALEWTGQRIRRPVGYLRYLGYLTLASVLAASLFFVAVQWQVNRLNWFFKYYVEADLASLNDPQVRRYFEHTNFARINWDYWQARHDLTKIPCYDRIRAGLSSEQMKDFLSGVQDLLSHPNLYW